MVYKRRMIPYILFVLFGAGLFGLGIAGVVDEFWSGMGSGLLVVGVLRLVRIHRFRSDDAYREKVEVETTDERNRFLRNKAWAWAGYLFILITAVAVIVLRLLGQDLLSMAASFAVCLMLILYWGSFFVLRKKY